MSALAVTTISPVRPTAPRASGPDCSRPRTHRVPGSTSGASVASCRVVRRPAEPTWQLTRRGLAAAMSLVGLVTGSAVVTLVTAFLSVGNGPL